MTEKWLPIPGYEGSYQVSDLGRVRNAKKGNVLKPWLLRGRYPMVKLGGRGKPIHQLVAFAFLGPRPEGMIVRHLNDIGTDNRPVNLAYGTHSENMHDTVRNGNHVQAGRTHCIRGHEFTPENTVRNGSGRGCRQCMYGRVYSHQLAKNEDSKQRGQARANTDAETWLPVPGYEKIYSISDQGRVLSHARYVARGVGGYMIDDRILSPGYRSGYAFVNLFKDKICRRIDVHHLVLLAFVGPRPEGEIVRHLNDDPIDNWLENLAYGTYGDNADDRVRNRAA